MTTYHIDPKASRLVVTARSSVHDTDTHFGGIEGTIDAKRDSLTEIRAQLTVDMKTADAGDWLKNRKLRKDMDFDKNPTASFRLEEVCELVEEGDAISATIKGQLQWRGKTVAVAAKGNGRISDTKLEASGEFDLDVTQLGITPPKVLMIKVADVVSCTIDVRADVRA